MPTSEDPTTKNAVAPDVEAQAASARNVEGQTPSIGVASIVNRWKREDMLKKGSLVLRGAGLVLSLLAFIIMACNKHGDSNDWRNFDKYEEYRYVLAIAILSTLYTAAQVARQIHQFSTGKELLSLKTSNLVDFFGDQLMAYLLLSSASSAVPKTNEMREGVDNSFTDSLAASISMAFLAFFALGLSAMVSGFRLSKQNYI